jgi:tripartite-type tricarboxylate transporter receptor subunit TctC
MNTIRRLILATITVLTFAATDLLADSYPNRRITLVIPFPAGGPTDSIARPLAQALTDSMGQAVIVENRTGGAGGTLGMRDVARALPDGYTLTLGTVSTLAVAPAFYKDPGFDPLTSFDPICTVSSEATVLVAASQVTARPLDEIVAYAKANPGKLNYGAATGTIAHLAGELFKLSTGTNIMFVPYKGGAAALTDALGGQIDLFFTTTSTVTPFISAGKLKPVIVMSEERVPQLPEIPTARERGYDLVAYFWTGLVAPAGTPPVIVDKLNSEINKVLAKPELRNAILKLSAQPMGGTPQAFAKLIAVDVPKWASVVKASSIRVY